jgi:hypothetical protein
MSKRKRKSGVVEEETQYDYGNGMFCKKRYCKFSCHRFFQNSFFVVCRLHKLQYIEAPPEGSYRLVKK